jgi:hypothetical protein
MSLGPSRIGTERTGWASRGCTATAQTNTSTRLIEWYHTWTLIWKVLRINLYETLDFVLPKASTGVDPHYLDVWIPAHQDVDNMIEKLVSTKFYSYSSFVIFVWLNVLHGWYTEELKRIHMTKVEDPFNVTSAYAVGRGTLHGMYMKASTCLWLDIVSS